MKAEIVIPKGWKLLRSSQRIQEGDRVFWGVELIWEKFHPAYCNNLTEHRCVIRPIPKAAKPSPKIKKGSAKK